ncbi:FAD-dependent oxidoreductase [Streptomyces sp. WAC06614]|uniref:FAD-dependent oxidoreductase n=1 Tax=Streptomyces sp. WAC06614 TaxID=2487416 RepID=UPI000F7A7304|nr:BBE domain-containing protein [Streptomyces sp. WAC06614]RSS80410.1 FAD-binding protein [Streptomyces sp. WAC06614]
MRTPKGTRTALDRRGFLAASAAGGAAALTGATAGPAGAAAAGAAAEPPVVVRPGDRRYADLVRGWNQRWVASPEAVHLVHTPAQALDAVQHAVRTGRRLSLRSGGHCYEDFVFHAGTEYVVDVSGMDKVTYDPAHRAFSVESGARLLDVYETLFRTWGVTVPAGICFSVGVGGHVSGGGWGMLCRRDGLVVDHLYGVEVVVVDASGTARLVTATREPDDPHRALWWAHTGGGGGSFGLVTRYLFRSPGTPAGPPAAQLPAPPAEVLLSAVSWSWEQLDRADFTALVDHYGRWHAEHSAPGTPYDGLCSYLVLGHRSQGTVTLVTQMDATAPDAPARLDAYLRAVTEGVRARPTAQERDAGEHPALPGFATPRRIPWLTATRHLGTTNGLVNDPTLHSDFKSAYLRRPFTPAQLASLHDHLTRDGANPTAGVTLSSFGGAVNAVAPDATASAHRDSAFKALWTIWWQDPSEEAGCLAWIREAYAAAFATTGGVPVPGEAADGAYVNYPDADLGDPRHNRSGVPWHQLYYKDNYARLQQVKQAYDPGDVFRHRQSVRLPGR